MTVTADEVAAAEKQAEDARAESKAAQDALVKANKDKAAAQKRVEAAQAAQKAASDSKTDLDQKAAVAKAEADSSGAGCTQAKAETAKAQKALADAKAKNRRVKAQHPGKTNAETEAAAEAVQLKESELEAARAHQAGICQKAADDAAAQKAAETAAANAAKPLADADTELREAKVAETAAADTVMTAAANGIQTSFAAFLAKTNAEKLANELAAQGASKEPPAARAPDTKVGCAVMGLPPPEKDPGGVRSDTHANFSITARSAIWNIGGYDYEETQGAAVEITVGEKISNLFGLESVNIAGGRFEEVGGWESKLVLGGDRRLIVGRRWERNYGLKAETVATTINEYTFRDTHQTVIAKKFGMNPTQSTEVTPEMLSESAKIVEKHKAEMKELRRQLKEHLTQATESLQTFNSRLSYYKAEIKNIRRSIEEKFEKCIELKMQGEKFKAKSDAFIKILVSGTCHLKCGDFKGSAKKKYHLAADAMAELKGQVKWN